MMASSSMLSSSSSSSSSSSPPTPQSSSISTTIDQFIKNSRTILVREWNDSSSEYFDSKRITKETMIDPRTSQVECNNDGEETSRLFSHPQIRECGEDDSTFNDQKFYHIHQNGFGSIAVLLNGNRKWNTRSPLQSHLYNLFCQYHNQIPAPKKPHLLMVYNLLSKKVYFKSFESYRLPCCERMTLTTTSSLKTTTSQIVCFNQYRIVVLIRCKRHLSAAFSYPHELIYIYDTTTDNVHPPIYVKTIDSSPEVIGVPGTHLIITKYTDYDHSNTRNKIQFVVKFGASSVVLFDFQHPELKEYTLTNRRSSSRLAQFVSTIHINPSHYVVYRDLWFVFNGGIGVNDTINLYRVTKNETHKTTTIDFILKLKETGGTMIQGYYGLGQNIITPLPDSKDDDASYLLTTDYIHPSVRYSETKQFVGGCTIWTIPYSIASMDSLTRNAIDMTIYNHYIESGGPLGSKMQAAGSVVTDIKVLQVGLITRSIIFVCAIVETTNKEESKSSSHFILTRLSITENQVYFEHSQDMNSSSVCIDLPGSSTIQSHHSHWPYISLLDPSTIFIKEVALSIWNVLLVAHIPNQILSIILQYYIALV